MDGQRDTAVIEHRGYGWTPKTNRRTYSRRDAILLGMSAAFGLAGAGMVRTVYHDLTTPLTALALPSTEVPNGQLAAVSPAPVDVSPDGHAMRIVTEAPMTSVERDEIAAEATRFAPFGAGTVVTVKKDWRPADGGYGEAVPDRIDLSDALLGDDPAALDRREIELPKHLAQSAVVNLAPHSENGKQLLALGTYLSTLESLTREDGREEALTALNPYSYAGSGLRETEDWQRERARMDDPSGLFAAVVTTWLRYPDSLIGAVEAMASSIAYPGLDPANPTQSGGVEAGPKVLTRKYLRAVSDLLIALVPNPNDRGDGYVLNELDRAIPGFTLTRANLGIGGS